MEVIQKNTYESQSCQEDFFEIYEKKYSEHEKLIFCLQYIQKKLSNQSISAIVGAGFSRNASQEFPDWATLLVDAYREMNPSISQKKAENEIVEAIKTEGEPNVASNYARFKGKREYLDTYIEKKISKIQELDLNLDVHKALLRLNWNNIITTNWDCLLEKAINDSGNELQRYHIIHDAKNLKVDNKNILAKIHGSIRPSIQKNKQKYIFDGCKDHLYIITKQDYDSYSRKHKLFSDFMRTTILQNTLCLFGFSGDDWNFKFWIKQLKKEMEKGGEKENLNPIFLFDINEKEYTACQEKFFRSNYIVPLKIDNVVNFIKKSYRNDGISEFQERRRKSIREKFNQIFEFFEIKTKEQVVQQKKKLTDDTFYSRFANANDTDTKEFINEYVNKPKFIISNLKYSGRYAKKAQSLYYDLHNWAEKEYIFIYSLCLNNFFSLYHLFKKEQAEKVIKHYIDMKLYKTSAKNFSLLILQYYFRTGNKDAYNSFILKANFQEDNLAYYFKCKFYTESLEYKKLKNLLKEWKLENSNETNPLFFLCKITALLSFEPFHHDNTKSKKIQSLFESALNKCSNKEYQLNRFILLYFSFFLKSINKKIPKKIQLSLDEIETDSIDYPQDFIEYLEKRKQHTQIQPNHKIRFQNTTIHSIDNMNDLSSSRIINFFEYLSLPMAEILSKVSFRNLILENKNDFDILMHLYSNSIGYFGHDSDEEYLQSVIPLFIRSFNSKQRKYVFNQTFKIFKYIVEHNKNPREYCFIMDEFSKRMESTQRKEYHEYFFKQFFNHKRKSNFLKILVQKGRVWGIYQPFINFLSTLDVNHDYIPKILKWLIKQNLKTDYNFDTAQLSFYDALIFNANINNILKKYFSIKSNTKELIKNIDSNPFLILDAFNLLNHEEQKIARKYISKNISLRINPSFIKKCYTPDLEKKVIDLIIKKDYKYLCSSEWPIYSYINVLSNTGKLNPDDLDQICERLKPLFIRLTKEDKKELIIFTGANLNKYFEIISEAALNTKSKKRKNIKECLDILGSIYKSNAEEIFHFKWIYTSNKQDLRNAFFYGFSYAEYLHKEEEYLFYVGMILAKFIIQDEINFEAILQIFITKCQEDHWQKKIKKNKTLIFYIDQIIKKFGNEIPLCYDDIFIKQKISELSSIFGKNI